MEKLRSCFLWYLVATYIVCPLWHLGFRVLARARGIHRVRLGNLSAWGDADFLSLCKESVDRLAKRDGNLRQTLTAGRWVWVIQVPDGVPYAGNLSPPWLFTIGPGYVSWRADGIVARLVYIAFCMTEFPTARTSYDDTKRRHDMVKKQARSWLEAHSFPQTLVDCYAEG